MSLQRTENMVLAGRYLAARTGTASTSIHQTPSRTAKFTDMKRGFLPALPEKSVPINISTYLSTHVLDAHLFYHYFSNF
jgi:hypothetical protein